MTGATCEIGRYLLPRLIAGGYTSLAVSRRPPVAGPSLKTEWIQGDISSPDFRIPLDKADILIHLAPLPLWSGLKDEITRLSLKRIIAFGTTSKIFKANSPDLGERRMVAGQIEAEKQLAEFGGQSGVAWTVFRPTIIYGEGPAKFVSYLANLIERFRFFPVVGGGLGKRQPVHADDLAMACLSALRQENTHNRSFNLSGGEVLSYREMVERIFHSRGKTPRIISLPLPVIRLTISLFRIFPRFRNLTPHMANRINEDLAIDSTENFELLGFSARKFCPGGEKRG